MFARVLIIDEIRIHRDWLAGVLGTHEALGTIFTSPLREARATARDLAPDLVLLNARDTEPYAAVQVILHEVPAARVLVLGVESEEEVLAHLEAGAAGYLLTDEPLEALRGVISAAARDELLCSPRVASALRQRVAALATERVPPTLHAQLTPREREILALIELGLSNKQIAGRLSISVVTVKNHIHNLLGKLQVRRRGEAVAQMRSLRLSIDPPP